MAGEIGIALCARALVADGGPDVEGLRAAVAELERSELALEHARALVELGAALRRGGTASTRASRWRWASSGRSAAAPPRSRNAP